MQRQSSTKIDESHDELAKSGYRTRPAYRHSVENSVYVERGAQRRGIGTALLRTLIRACTDRGFRQMVAIIGDSAHAASIRLHRTAGFEMVGTLTNVGYKHGRHSARTHRR